MNGGSSWLMHERRASSTGPQEWSSAQWQSDPHDLMLRRSFQTWSITSDYEARGRGKIVEKIWKNLILRMQHHCVRRGTFSAWTCLDYINSINVCGEIRHNSFIDVHRYVYENEWKCIQNLDHPKQPPACHSLSCHGNLLVPLVPAYTSLSLFTHPTSRAKRSTFQKVKV